MNNRFDTVRLAAALAVFAAHGVVLYQLTVLRAVSGPQPGRTGSRVFSLSVAALCCQKLDALAIMAGFWRKRMLHFPQAASRRHADRLPARPWWTTGRYDYWRAPATWWHWVNNAFAMATLQTLPGCSEHNPFARAVNGSLWTIRF